MIETAYTDHFWGEVKGVCIRKEGNKMSEQGNFKTTIMGGYDKDSVNETFQQMKDEAAAEQLRLKKMIIERDKKIEELTKRIQLKETHQEKLEKEIQEKYQKYVDNYESIGKLVFDAQVRAESTVQDAQKEAEKIREEAEKEADQIRLKAEQEAKEKVESVQGEINLTIGAGKENYKLIREELDHVLQIIDEAQQRLACANSEAHQIIEEMPDSIQIEEKQPELPIVETKKEEITEEPVEQITEEPKIQFQGAEEDQDEDSKMALQISKLLMMEDEALLEEEESGNL